MSEDKVEEMKRFLIYDFQQYTEPTATVAPMKQMKKRKVVDEQSLLPLANGLLTNNLGIPIVVVCCKSDMTEMLSKEYAFKESHFDYIHQYLRRICLSYGASLIYTSGKKNVNCDVLLSYLRHKLYGFEFVHKFDVTEKETVFVPSGADSMARIQLDFSNQNLTKDPEDSFDEIIKVPKRLLQKASTPATLVVAGDDQEFLAKHKELMDKEDETPKEPKVKTEKKQQCRIYKDVELLEYQL